MALRIIILKQNHEIMGCFMNLKYLSVYFFLFFLSGVISAADKAVIHYDFMPEKIGSGLIENLASDRYKAKIHGKYSVSPDQTLFMDGKSTSLVVEQSENLNLGNEMTFMFVYRKHKNPDNSKSDLNMDALAGRKKSFVVSRLANNLYANLYDGKKWSANFQIPQVFAARPDSFHHIVWTVRYVNNINEAEEFTEMEFYFDGRKVGGKRFNDVRLINNDSVLEIGSADFMGSPWKLGGEIGSVRIFDRVLSEREICQYAAQENLITPNFEREMTLPTDVSKAVEALNFSPARKSAVRNIARGAFRNVDWRSIAADPEKYLLEIPSKESVLTVLETKDFAHIVSWYDLKNQRELLMPDSKWVNWTFERGKRLFDIDPLNRKVKSRLHRSSAPAEFKIEYHCSSDRNFPFSFKAQTVFRFADDRLVCYHTADCLSQSGIIHTVKYPDVKLAMLESRSEKVFVPEGPGVVHKLPVQKGFRYNHPYPRAFCSMQYGAYYDDSRGIFFAAADPAGRSKRLHFEGKNNNLNMAFSVRVPYDAVDKPNRFDMASWFVMELFNGDWFDGAMIYRKLLHDIKAPWMMRRLRTPEYFRNNCYWLHEAYFGFVENDFIKLKNYIGLDCCRVDTWSWWEKGRCNYLTPVMRADPQWIEYMKYMRQNGIRVIPYTNGRLWAQLDKRGEDCFYSRYGKPNTVISDGTAKQEKYAVACDVICPATPGYQKFFSDFFIRLGAQGADGIYIDQLGATQHFPCHAPNHGHRLADYDAWNLKGYIPMLEKVRDMWEKRGEEKFLTTEDNAEFLVGLIDGMQGYRWMNNGQVPAFHAVYGNRVQYYNRRAASTDAKIQTLAEQLTFGEQLGAFTVRELTFPFIRQFRHYAKKMIYFRHALLPFFNQGEMAKSLELSRNIQSPPLLWGMFGSKYVEKPAIQTAVWRLGDVYAAVLVNSSDKKVKDCMKFDFAVDGKEFEIYFSNGSSLRRQGTQKLDFELAPREFMLVTVYPADKYPADLQKYIKDDFRKIGAVAIEVDPYDGKTPADKAVLDPRKGMNLVDSVIVSGARRNRKDGFVDYNYLTFIYAGLFDFGSKAPAKIALEVACSHSFTGAVQIYEEEILPENKIAEITISDKFKTASNKDFKYITAPLLKKITGKKRIIFTCDGFFTYNLRSWRVMD